ncbi:MAG: hypothetical protein HYT22_01655 [Candidatus Niyogibacteria bacterium]|nr:hypothetical protein [Candidatus Niyogibacteria bacterium]
MYLWLFVLMVLNFGISWFNAWSVGHTWPETQTLGGWPKFLAWCGAVMSACGFTWVYLIVLALIAGAAGWLEPRYVEAMLSLGYLVIIAPVLGSGIALTIESWMRFWKQRTFGSGAVAGWNTFAQVYNMYQGVSAIPRALGNVMDVFGDRKSSRDDGDSGKGAMAMLAILLVVVAVAGGVLTTTLILRHAAKNHARAMTVMSRQSIYHRTN